MLPYIMAGVAIVAAIAIIGYLAHHHANPTLPAATDVVTGVLSGLPTADDIASALRKELAAVPALVSKEVVRLQDALQAETDRANAAEVEAAKAKADHAQDRASWVARVTTAIGGQAPPGQVVTPAATGQVA